MSMHNASDYRAASGLRDYERIAREAELNGPGLFAVNPDDSDSKFVTNVRRLAGNARTPGSRIIAFATWALFALGAGLLYVSLNAQYHDVLSVKHESVPAMIEAMSPDGAMIILSALAIGLALAGKASKAERILIVSFAGLAAFMNYAPADPHSWRSVAAYIAPPIVLAVITDRVISVIRRHVLPEDAESAWKPLGRALVVAAAVLGKVLVYILAVILAPRSTLKGLRRMVLDAAPVPAPPVRLVIEPGEPRAEIPPPPPVEPPELAGASKKARLAWWYEQDPGYGNRSAVAAAAKRLAPKVDLSEGTARAYLGQICDDLERDGRAS